MTGSSKSSNGAMVAEQQAQANEARAKEIDRQKRIDQGLAGIRNAFEGSPIMGTRKAAETYNTSDLPAGWTMKTRAETTGATPGTAGTEGYYSPGGNAGASGAGGSGEDGFAGRGGATTQGYWKSATGGDNVASQWVPGADPFAATEGYYSNPTGGDNVASQWNPGKPGTAANPGTTKSYRDIYDNNGKLIRTLEGDSGNESYTDSFDESYDTGGRSGGFGDDFYNKYKQGILDYYTPQVDEQFGDAKKELTFRLARSGLGRSGVAADETGKLSKQYDLNTSQVRSKADAGAADLRNRVASERTKAESQLYATENPDVAVNQALGSVRNISLDQPELSPLAEIFKVGSIGGAGLTKGYNNGKANMVAGGGNSPSGGLVGDAWRYVTG
jgi:hypothetical protein